MEFLALIHADETAWLNASEDERAAVYGQYRDLSEEAQAAGVLVDGAELAPVATATTVRVRDGQTLVSDGPYAEVKEVLGGYFLFDCSSIEEALEWAARIPAASSGAVEVRPVHVDPEA
jgi:hypothetical protein